MQSATDDDEFHDLSDARRTPAKRTPTSKHPASASFTRSTDALAPEPFSHRHTTSGRPATVPEHAPAVAAPHDAPFLTSIPIGSGPADHLVPSVDFEDIPPPEADSTDLSTVIDQTFNITSRQFFEFFLADRAVFSFSEFHLLRGDKDTYTTPWRPLLASDPTAAATLAADPRLTAGTIERRMKVQLKVDSAFSRLHKVQRLVPLPDGFLMVSRGCTPDVMFGTQFAVTDIWRLSDVPGARRCRLEIQLGGAFPDAGWAVRMLMPVITSRIKTEGQEMWQKWAEVARLRVAKLAHELTDGKDAAISRSSSSHNHHGHGHDHEKKSKKSSSTASSSSAGAPAAAGASATGSVTVAGSPTAAAGASGRGGRSGSSAGSGSGSCSDSDDPMARSLAAPTAPSSALQTSTGGCVLPEDDPAVEGLSDVEEARERTLQQLKAIEMASEAEVGDAERKKMEAFIRAQVKAQQAAIAAREREKAELKQRLVEQEQKKKEIARQRALQQQQAQKQASEPSSRAIDSVRNTPRPAAVTAPAGGPSKVTYGSDDDDEESEESSESDTPDEDVAQMGPEEFARHERRLLRRAKARRRRRRRMGGASAAGATNPAGAESLETEGNGPCSPADLGVPPSPLEPSPSTTGGTPDSSAPDAGSRNGKDGSSSGSGAGKKEPLTLARIAAEEARIQAQLEEQNNRMCSRQCRPQQGSCAIM